MIKQMSGEMIDCNTSTQWLKQDQDSCEKSEGFLTEPSSVKIHDPNTLVAQVSTEDLCTEDLPLDLSPNPQADSPLETNETDLSSANRFDNSGAEKAIVQITNLTGNNEKENFESVKKDESGDKDMDCFSFNFSIKKSFFTQNGNGSGPQQQEVLLMDKMMKHCFGYIILSRSADSNSNSPPEVTFHPKLSPTKIEDSNRLSPADSVMSNFTDIEPELENKTLDLPMTSANNISSTKTSSSAGPSPAFGQSTRNKRKRVMPQQRDTVIQVNKSVVSPTFDLKTEVETGNGYLDAYKTSFTEVEPNKPSGSGIDNLAMDLSASINNNHHPDQQIDQQRDKGQSNDDNNAPLDLTQKVSPVQKVSEPSPVSRPSPVVPLAPSSSAMPPVSMITSTQNQNQNPFAAFHHQQQVATLAAAAAGLLPQFAGAAALSNHRNAAAAAAAGYLGTASQVPGADNAFASLINASTSPMSQLFNAAASPNFESYLDKYAPAAKKMAFGSKMIKDEVNLLSQMSGQTPDRNPLGNLSSGISTGTKQGKSMGASPSSGNKELIACGVCGKRFKTYAYIKDHMRLHTGEKPFQCTYCPASFPNKSHLNYHIKSKHHPGLNSTGSLESLSGISMGTSSFEFPSGDSPILKCELCLRQFNSKSALTLHMKRCGQRTESVIMGANTRNTSPSTSPQMPFFNDCASVMPQAAPGGSINDVNSSLSIPHDLSNESSIGNPNSPTSMSNLYAINQSIEATIQSVTGGLR
ncbi:uncharacterized protein LOC142337743 isoform X3 [Convolutriloba macropyga]|uniref:uncharacterized protein LOC142337743 isoform X3 n=1 Tax=Convolutriloba macropyga TaxID=536237 RepID=UPI003F51B597